MASEEPGLIAYLHATVPVPVREDLLENWERIWQHIATPGAWWSGAQRVEIASETRRARECAVCTERNAGPAGSPMASSSRPSPSRDAISVDTFIPLDPPVLEFCGDLASEFGFESFGSARNTPRK